MNTYFFANPELWDQIHDAIIATDLSGMVRACNHAAEEIYGYPRDEFIGMSVSILYPPEEQEHLPALIEQVHHSGTYKGELRNVTKDGREIYILLSVALLKDGHGTPCGMIGFSIENTEQRKAEKRLRDIEQRGRAARAAAGTGTWYWNLEDGSLGWDEQSSLLLDLPDDAPQNYEAFISAVHPEDRRRVGEAIREALEKPVDYDLEYRVMRSQGAIRWLHARGRASWKPGSAAPSNIMGVATDITDRKLIEEKLERAEAQYRALFDSGVIGLCTATLDGITDVNDAFCKMVGYSREELTGGKVRWEDITPPEHIQKDYAGLQQMMATGVCPAFQKEYIRNDGKRIVVLIGAAVLTREPLTYSCFVLDLTAQHKAQQALSAGEKLASAARMGSMLAHEINNPLAGLTNILYLLRHQADPSEGDLLSAAQELLERITRITRQMIGIYSESSRPSEFRLAELLEDTLAGSSARIRAKDLKVEKRNHLSDRKFFGVESDFRQLFTALVENAVENAPTGASIKVRLHPARESDNDRRAGVRIIVADNGPGIAKEKLQHVFEPFYTTKQQKASGLGLWTTRQIVQKYNGKIRIRSSTEPGRSGTLISVFLHTNAMPTQQAAHD